MQVALVTVGNELLTGDTTNTNATWLGRQLAARGATLQRVTVVPDRVDDIAQVVGAYADTFDAVIVTGGLGPTHDDLTMEGVAAALDRDVVHNEEALSYLTEHGGYSHEELVTGTAHLPAGAEPLHNEVGVAPGAVVESIYVLPGVPGEMKAMFDTIADAFYGERRHVRTLHADEPESALVDRLQRVEETFGVRVGSYPGNGVRIKLSGTDANAVDQAMAWLANRIDGGPIDGDEADGRPVDTDGTAVDSDGTAVDPDAEHSTADDPIDD